MYSLGMPWPGITEHLRDIALSFLSILLEGLPFMLLGTLVSGLVDALLPSHWMDRWLPKNRHLAVLAAGACGLVFPMCECGVVPVIRRLMIKGLPVSCAVTYMLAAPILNPVTAFSTWMAFRGQSADMTTFLRLLLGYIVPVLAGFVILRIPAERLLKASLIREVTLPVLPDCCVEGHGKGRSFLLRLRHALETAGKDFIEVSAYLVLGALIVSVFNTSVPQEQMEVLAEKPMWAVPVMMGLAYMLALCSSSDAFVAATFLSFPLSAKLAFLVFGPMMDLKLTFLYATTFRKRFVLVLGLSLFVLIGALCLRAGVALW